MEPVGGVARLKTLFDNYRRRSDGQRPEREGEKENGRLPELLTFFSGDAFNPSLESSVTKGEFFLFATLIGSIFRSLLPHNSIHRLIH